MKNILINSIKSEMEPHLNEMQMSELVENLEIILNDFEVFKKDGTLSIVETKENQDY